MSIEAMKLALDCLEDIFGKDKIDVGAINALRQAIAEAEKQEPVQAKKLWLWKNFVNGIPEYWAFDNAFPDHIDCGDPQTIGEPCGYALFKPSRKGRQNVSDEEVLNRIIAALGIKGET